MYELAYVRPQSLTDALAMLAQDDGAQALSGGQTLMPVLRARLAMPTRLVDLARLHELAGITPAGDGIEIGAATTHHDVSTSSAVRSVLPALAGLAGGIGDAQIRHRGTIGGSIANNDPAACYPSALLALGASITTSQRTLAAQDFFTGMFSTALEPGEIVRSIRLPACDKARYIKFRNPASRFALVGVFAARLPGGYRIAITGGATACFAGKRRNSTSTAAAASPPSLKNGWISATSPAIFTARPNTGATLPPSPCAKPSRP
ncbi:xanthine dehydrogenase family protein subunit M [Novosphingobium sp. THN1]|uniref:FAD binding domain-containing protein n=1 Tax=Novosphingobium sp. THN1 TaxID=1016987 RepID=UPI0026A37410